MRNRLPGDGSIQAIRDEHDHHRNLLAANGGSHPRVDPGVFARIEKLLAEIDDMDAEIDRLIQIRWPDGDPC
jgi:hypothetical protein